MRVIVVGGGIGGLCGASGFRRAGHNVVVLERAPRVDPAGAGITLFGNAMRALDRLGVAKAIAARGAQARRSAILAADGRELADVPTDLLRGAIALRRTDVQAVLADAAGEIRLGVEVTSVEQEGDTVVAIGADGSEERGDLLVGADGVNSVVRRSVADAQPRYAGYTAWRGISGWTYDPGRLTESWGVGERFGLIDIGHGRTYWFATKNAPEGEEEEPDGRKTEIARRFADWHEPIAAVIAATDEGAILRNDVYYLEPLRRWSTGRVVLLGDAAHATTPGVGQGAAQAIEDAVVLTTRVTGNSHTAEALGDYERTRRPRVESVLKLSRRADWAAQLDGALACRVRNAVVRRVPPRVQRRQLAPIVHHDV
jgi:2-polyprenyl-6-methoxyphenol hydroxylase-like FAD-dependent oxidoreductase